MASSTSFDSNDHDPANVPGLSLDVNQETLMTNSQWNVVGDQATRTLATGSMSLTAQALEPAEGRDNENTSTPSNESLNTENDFPFTPVTRGRGGRGGARRRPNQRSRAQNYRWQQKRIRQLIPEYENSLRQPVFDKYYNVQM